MWARDGDGKGCNWGDPTDWDSAVDYCDNLDFDGYDDWRLPNIKELQSIIDYGRANPAIDTDIFNTYSDYHWSSTSSLYDTDSALRADFGYGGLVYRSKTDTYYVRAVRGGE
jgi:hypothetical protein